MTPYKKEKTDVVQEEKRPTPEEVTKETKPLGKRVMVVFRDTLSGGIVSANSHDRTKDLEVCRDRNGFLREVRVLEKRTRKFYTVPLANIKEVCEG
jgi:hypothetical protein